MLVALVALVALVSLTVAVVVPPVLLALVVRVIAPSQEDCRRFPSRPLIGALRRQSL